MPVSSMFHTDGSFLLLSSLISSMVQYSLHSPHSSNFSIKRKKHGKCRNGREDCEDCMVTDVDKLFTVHYTQCKFATTPYSRIIAVPYHFWLIHRLNCITACHCLLRHHLHLFGYTVGRKPWNCISLGHGGGRIPGGPKGTAIDTNAGNLGKSCN